MNEPLMTLTGNLTDDPEIRFTETGRQLASLTVASTPRIYDRDSGEWRDGETHFQRCTVWGDYADNIAESLATGTRVIVTGRLKSRRYEDEDGNPRTVTDLDVDEIGPSLRFATADVHKSGPVSRKPDPQTASTVKAGSRKKVSRKAAAA